MFVEIVEADEGPGAAEAVKNLREMYKGCMDTVAIEAAGLGQMTEVVGGSGAGWPMIQDGWTGDRFGNYWGFIRYLLAEGGEGVVEANCK